MFPKEFLEIGERQDAGADRLGDNARCRWTRGALELTCRGQI